MQPFDLSLKANSTSSSLNSSNDSSSASSTLVSSANLLHSLHVQAAHQLASLPNQLKMLPPGPAHSPASSASSDFHSSDFHSNDFQAGDFQPGNSQSAADYKQQAADAFLAGDVSPSDSLKNQPEFKIIRDKDNNFSCQYCSKKYQSMGALKMHVRTHTLPCQCKLCGKSFSRPWLLQGHIRTHTGEKPFKCDQCHRAFADRSNLRAHLQTHAKVKKYSCKCCLKTFSRMSLQVKHEEHCNNNQSRCHETVNTTISD